MIVAIERVASWVGQESCKNDSSKNQAHDNAQDGNGQRRDWIRFHLITFRSSTTALTVAAVFVPPASCVRLPTLASCEDADWRALKFASDDLLSQNVKAEAFVVIVVV